MSTVATKDGTEISSHPGRSGPDELVPSRYALRVGEIDVMVVSDGVLSLPGAMLAHNVDPAVRAAWLNDMFLPPDVLEWALNVILVRSGGLTILIDAGLGADPNLNLPRAGRLVQRLEAAGIDLASVTDVVLTHLHMDHIGGRRGEGPAESGPADPPGGGRDRILGVARFNSSPARLSCSTWHVAPRTRLTPKRMGLGPLSPVAFEKAL